jgi:hypothetical protein
MDTNMNEGFNNICTWFAPKNKVYAGNGSLVNRIGFAVCINSMGVLPFYTKLFRRMGITMSENVEHFLRVRESQRMKMIERGKSKEAKKDRNKMKYQKLQEVTRTAKMEFHKRAGTYRRGMNMDDPFGELLNGQEQPNEARKPAAKRKASTGGFCEYCGSADHLTKRSKNCKAGLAAQKKFRRLDGTSLLLLVHPEEQGNDTPVPAGFLNDAAQETDLFDSLPFDHQFDSDDDDSLAGFFDARSDEEEDDGEGIVRACL